MILQFYRRIFIIVLACCVLCTGVFSAAASSYTPGYDLSYDVLSLATADGDNHVTVGSSVTLSFDLPYTLMGNYVDFVVSTVGGNITAAHAGIAGGTRALTVTKIGDGLFRCYGSTLSRTFSQIRVILQSDSDSTQADFLSFRLFKSAVNIHETLGRVSFYDLVNEGHYGQTAYGEVITCPFNWSTGDNEISIANILLTCPTWQKYDYVEFMVYGKFASVDAIIARVDDVSVPFSVTLLDGTADIYGSHSDNTWRNMVISVDVRDVVRSSTPEEDLRLRIDMNLSYYLGAQAVFYLSTVNGIVDVPEVDPVLQFLRNIYNSVVSGFASLESSLGGKLDTLISKIESSDSASSAAIVQALLILRDSLIDHADSVDDRLIGIDSSVGELQTALLDKLDGVRSRIVTALTALQTDLSDKLTTLDTDVVDGLEAVRKSVGTLTTGFTQWVMSDWNGFVSNWNTTMAGLQSSMESWMETLDNNLTSLWSNVSARWNTYQNIVVSWFTKLDNNLTSLWTNISARWDTFQTWLKETFDPDSSGIDNAGDQIGDDVDAIEKVEQDIMGDFDDNAHVVTDAFNIASFASAFAFVGSILSGVWSGLDGYQVVLTLPIALGIVLYVCNRVPGAMVGHQRSGTRNASDRDAVQRDLKR